MTKIHPKVSVIIPVYNTQEYVKGAVLSIVNQTLREIEIIVINDGSTDNSLQVINEIALEDERIKVYTQKNTGQGGARNNGLSKAIGEFVYFMDSDDLLEIDALECCYNQCVKDNLDFVFFDADIFCEEENYTLDFDYHRTHFEENKIYKGTEVMDYQLSTYEFRVPIWLLFIRLSFLKEKNIIFHLGMEHEDELFTTLIYLESSRMGRIIRTFFKRRLRGNSTMTKKYALKNIMSYLIAVEQLLIYGKNKEEKIKQLIDKRVRYILNPAIYRSRNFTLKERIKIFYICLNKGYLEYLKIKNIIVLLLPFTVRLKYLLKKRHKKLY